MLVTSAKVQCQCHQKPQGASLALNTVTYTLILANTDMFCGVLGLTLVEVCFL